MDPPLVGPGENRSDTEEAHKENFNCICRAAFLKKN